MSTVLRRRIKQLERLVDQVATSDKPSEVVLLSIPAEQADPEAMAQFLEGKRAAMERGAFVIVMVPLGSAQTVDEGDQVKVVNHEWEAQMLALAHTPSTQREGNTALDDVIASLGGHVIGAVPQHQGRWHR